MIKKYGVIGDPIEHSLSPIIHKEFSDHFGIQLQYEKYLVKDNQLSDFINQSKSSFWAGLNLTIPHKIKAIDCVDELDLSAIEAGAINTIHFYDGKSKGYNTDGSGLIYDLKNNLNIKIQNKKILIIGAGGAVKGILSKLILERPEDIYIYNRTKNKIKEIQENYLKKFKINEINNLCNSEINFDLIINAIPSSFIQGLDNFIDYSVLNKSTVFYDLSYGSISGNFKAWCNSKNVTYYDGLGMLIEQAADSFLIWEGKRPKITDRIKKIITDSYL